MPELDEGICEPSDVAGVKLTEVEVDLLSSVPDLLPNFHVKVFLLPEVLCVIVIDFEDPIVQEDGTEAVSFVPETGHDCMETVPERETDWPLKSSPVVQVPL